MLCLWELFSVFKIFCSRPRITIFSVLWPRKLDYVMSTRANRPNIALQRNIEQLQRKSWTLFFNFNFYFSSKSRICYIKNVTMLIPFGFHEYQNNLWHKFCFCPLIGQFLAQNVTANNIFLYYKVIRSLFSHT